jgi:Zn-dependent peptidase ImmA (M78 family)
MLKTIKIGPFDYSVKMYDVIKFDADEGEKYVTFGTINPGTQEISLIKGMTAQNERLTLLHEVVHGIFQNIGMVEQDESLVSALSNNLMDVIKRNPKLIDYLQGRTT